MNYKHFYISPKYSDSDKSYYGNVTGEKDLGMLEAATVEDLEKLFHQKVDDYLEEKKARSAKRRTGWIVAAIAVIALLASMAVTCPDKTKHKEVLTDRLSVLFNDNVSEDSSDWAFLGAMIGNKLVGAFMENSLVVDNYILFSLGRLSYGGEERVVSVGVLGHIFAASREQIREKVSNDEEVQKFLKGLF